MWYIWNGQAVQPLLASLLTSHPLRFSVSPRQVSDPREVLARERPSEQERAEVGRPVLNLQKQV